MLTKTVFTVLAASTILLGFGSPEERGKEVFGRRCSGCHATDLEKEGPRLRGVYGRHAASVPGFAYSDVLKKSGIVWNEETLSRWLTDPEAMAPNNDMAFRLSDAQERTAVIFYLKSLAETKH